MTRALLLALLAGPASAQGLCMDHATIGRYLGQRFGEAKQSVALDGAGRLVEAWANPDTGTWTFVVTSPEGLSCMFASGQSWEPVAPEPEGELG